MGAPEIGNGFLVDEAGVVVFDRGGVAEELLDVTLVAVGRLGVAHGGAQSEGLDEGFNRSGRGVAIVETGSLQSAIVDAAAIAQQPK